MRYSDENRNGLMSLLSGLESGMDPTTAYGMFQDIQGNQDALIQQRKERQAGLIGMLMEAAQGGMPAQGAEAMMQAAPGPYGPALKSAYNTLYPSADEGGPDLNYLGNVMNAPVGNPAPDNPIAMTGLGPQSTSTVYQPPTPSISEQLAMQEAEQTAMVDQQKTADLTAVQGDAAAARAQQWGVDDFIAKSQAENPEMWAQYPEEMMAIVENTFGSAAVDMRGAPGLG